MFKKMRLSLALAAAIGHLSFAAAAQDFPTKPIMLVTAFTPGGPSDLLARIVGEKMSELLGQPVVVESHIGGEGIVAGEYVAKAPADGYTLLLGNNAILAANMKLFDKPGYDAISDFAPIARIGTQPNILVVNPNLPAKSVPELVELAKSKPGELDFANSGRGAAAFLSAMLFNKEAGLDIVPIDYKGSAPGLQDVMAGEVDMMFATSASVLGHIKAGALRPLAVTTPERSPALPDLPTMAESGFPGFDTTTWHGIVVAAATPKEIANKLSKAALDALADPATQKKLTDLGVDVQPLGPEEFGGYIKEQNPKWAHIVEVAGVKLD
jgi:tripartite-type tricarboxylate transporter receptor subunit TctC